MLPAGHFVLGVDSHTALVLDFVEATATVMGIGSVTVRAGGHSEVFPTGSMVPIGALAEAAERLRAGRQGISRAPGLAPGPGVSGLGPGSARSTPLDDQVRELEARIDEQLAAGQVTEAVGTILAMDQTLLDWSRDTDGSDDLDRARNVFRSLIVRLGERVAQAGRGSADERLGPLVELLIDLRGRARVSREFQQADLIRDTLTAAGIELRDGVDGTTWDARRGA